MKATNNFLTQYLVICSVFLVLGCKSADPNPELKDPIYNDLVKDLEELKEDLLIEEEKYKGLLDERLKVAPRSDDKLRNKVDTTKSQLKLQKIRQTMQYLEIKKERRRVEGRRSYKIAFSKGEEWPDPQEYQNYLTHKRLKNAPKDWNLRVPKLKKKKHLE